MRFCALLALVSIAILRTSTALPVGLVRTRVTVAATAYDNRTSSAGCTPNGCIPGNTRDGSTSSNSRWSCKKNLGGGNCKITYYFEEPQDLVKMSIAFHEGDENTRRLKIKVNGSTFSTIGSSGDTLGYQHFTFSTVGTEKLSLETVGLGGDEWIGIKEVKFWGSSSD